MSSDNWIAIIKTRGRFDGYHLSASVDYPTLKSIKEEGKSFSVKTVEEAILEAQKIQTEYGYEFMNLKVAKG